MTKKIVVLKRRQLAFGAILSVIALAVVILFIALTRKGSSDGTVSQQDARYIPGIYHSDIQLSEYTLQLEMAIDRDCIKSIEITNLDESILAMYPLIEPSLQAVSEQLVNGIEIDAVTTIDDRKFTQMMLIEAIGGVLEKAAVSSEE